MKPDPNGILERFRQAYPELAKLLDQMKTRKVYIVTCRLDEAHWSNPLITEDAAFRHVLRQIGQYVGGRWNDYSLRGKRRLRDALRRKALDDFLKVWNEMSVLKIDVEERTVLTEPELSEEEREMFERIDE